MEQASENAPKKGRKKISEEIARQEVDKWLDYKRVSEEKRADNEAAINGIVAAVANGSLIISDQGHEITHVLMFPIGTNEDVKELTYKARLSLKERNKRTKGVKPTDTGDYIAAIIAALAGDNKAVIEEMDTEDYNIVQNIALFFI